MATYVTADIHGEYDKFERLLERINLRYEDMLFILGDIIDRGPHPIKIIRKIINMPNVICLIGNHEWMALECVDFLFKEITHESIGTLDRELWGNVLTWYSNGAEPTANALRKLNPEERGNILDFIKDFSLFEEISVGDKDYVLVHAGLGNFRPDKDLDDYEPEELIWERPDFNVPYYPDRYVITGHTPTQLIEGNPKPGYIYRHNNHIAIDCGACFDGGRLAAICLDTDEEFYVE